MRVGVYVLLPMVVAAFLLIPAVHASASVSQLVITLVNEGGGRPLFNGSVWIDLGWETVTGYVVNGVVKHLSYILGTYSVKLLMNATYVATHTRVNVVFHDDFCYWIRPLKAVPRVEGSLLNITLIIPVTNVVAVHVLSSKHVPLPYAEVALVRSNGSIISTCFAETDSKGCVRVAVTAGYYLGAWWPHYLGSKGPLATPQTVPKGGRVVRVDVGEVRAGSVNVVLPLSVGGAVNLSVEGVDGRPVPWGYVWIDDEVLNVVNGRAKVPLTLIGGYPSAKVVIPECPHTFLGYSKYVASLKLLKGRLVVPVRSASFTLHVRTDSGAPVTALAKVITYARIYGSLSACTVLNASSYLVVNVTGGVLKLRLPTSVDGSSIPRNVTLVIMGRHLRTVLRNGSVVTVDLRPPRIKILKYEVRKTVILGTPAVALYIYVKADDPGPYGSGVAEVTLQNHKPLEVVKVSKDVWRIMAFASTAPGALFSDYVVVKDRQGNTARAYVEAKLVLPKTTTPKARTIIKTATQTRTRYRTLTTTATTTKIMTVTITKTVSTEVTKTIAAVTLKTKTPSPLKNPVVIALLIIIAALSTALAITISKLSKLKTQTRT